MKILFKAFLCLLPLVGVATMVMAETHDNGLRDTASRYFQLVDSADYCLRMEQWPRAESYLKRALQSDPANSGNTLLFSNLGVCQTQQGKLEEALQSFNLALTRAGKSSTILTLRARVLLALGHLSEAESDLGDILQTDSINEWALQTRGLLRLKKEYEGQMHGAATRFADLIKLRNSYPENPWGWYGSGMMYAINGESGSAIENLDKGWQLEHNPEIAFQLAMLLLEEGRLEEAGKCLRETLREHPRDGNLYIAMARLHRLSYQTAEADADLKLARQYGASPEFLEIYFKPQKGVR